MSPNQPMSIDSSLQLIDTVCAMFSGTREDHQNLITAIGVIQEAVKPAEPTEPKTAGSEEIRTNRADD
jgi:hypothetical protein